MFEIAVSILSIVVTSISIIVTIISLRQTAQIHNKHQKSNRSTPKD